MTDKEALKLALEALDIVKIHFTQNRHVNEAITAIKEALAQPAPVRDTEAHYKAVVEGVQKLFNDKRTQPASVQEPVAWMEMVVANLVREGVNKHKARALAEHFYTTPPAQPAPYIAVSNDRMTIDPHTGYVSIGTVAQRTWVGLTEEDLKLLSAEWRIVYGAWMDDFARDIEAKLKEKNK